MRISQNVYIFPFEEARAPLRWIKAARHPFCSHQKLIRIKFETRLPFRCFIKVGISRFKVFAHCIFYVNVMSWQHVNTGKVNALNLKYPRISQELVTYCLTTEISLWAASMSSHIHIHPYLGEVIHTRVKRWKTRVASVNCVVFQHGWWANMFFKRSPPLNYAPASSDIWEFNVLRFFSDSGDFSPPAQRSRMLFCLWRSKH